MPLQNFFQAGFVQLGLLKQLLNAPGYVTHQRKTRTIGMLCRFFVPWFRLADSFDHTLLESGGNPAMIRHR